MAGWVSDHGVVGMAKASTSICASFSCVIGVSAFMIPVIKFLSVMVCIISYASSNVAWLSGWINSCPLVWTRR